MVTQKEIQDAMAVLQRAIFDTYGKCDPDDDQVSFTITGGGVALTDRENGVRCHVAEPYIAAANFQLMREGDRCAEDEALRVELDKAEQKLQSQ